MHTSTGTVILVGWAFVVPLLPTVPASAAEAVCEGRAATHIGTEGDDVLVGTDGDDVMVGLGGDDTVSGLLGNDVICGDAGSDRLAGMAGDDRILGGRDSDAGGDVIWPGTGSDHVDAGLDPLTLEDYSVPADTIKYEDLLEAGVAGGIRVDLSTAALGGLGVVVEPSGTDHVVVAELLAIVGTREADVMIGSAYPDVLAGRGGADQIDGGGGHDALYADYSDNDVLPEADGPDEIDGGPGSDWIVLGRAGGTARGGEDPDHLAAGPASGQADLHGEDGADEILVAATEDVDVEGGAGRDSIVLGLTPGSRGISLDGGSSNDLALLHVRNAGFPQGSTITVDLARRVLHTGMRAGRLHSLELMGFIGKDEQWRVRGTHRNESVLLRGGRGLEARMGGGRDTVVGTRGPDVLDMGGGRDFANGRQGRDTCLAAERVRSCENVRGGRSDRAVRQAREQARDALGGVVPRTSAVPRLPVGGSGLHE